MKKIISTLLALFFLFSGPIYANGTVVLLVDVSQSLSIPQINLQMEAYASALLEIDTLEHVNIEVITFSNRPNHIASGSRETASIAFSSYSQGTDTTRGATCINSALEYVEQIFHTLPAPVVIDISGDGESNCPEEDGKLIPTLDRLEQLGVQINTLYVTNAHLQNLPYIGSTIKSDDNLRSFYESMTRNFGFTMTAASFEDFEDVLIRKLSLEVAYLDIR